MADGEKKPLLIGKAYGGDQNNEPTQPLDGDTGVVVEERVVDGDDDTKPVDPLETKRNKLNTMFGVTPFNYHIAKKQNREIREDQKDETSSARCQTLGYVIWVLLYGWWLSLFFVIASGLLFLTVVGRRYGKLCWKLKSYYIWPWGKFVIEKVTVDEDSSLVRRASEQSRPLVPYIVWLIVFCIFLLPIMIISYVLNWFFVISIPMAKVNWAFIRLLLVKPWAITIKDTYEGAQAHEVLLCTHQAFNPSYFKHSVMGMNIVFFNLFPLVAVRVLFILLGMILGWEHIMNPVFQFFLDLVCSIPITFYIGLAISSIAAQTNYMIGALLNASFGSITELTLYTIAITKSGLDDLVLYSVTGGLLSDMLLLPGLSMIAGGFKYKEQKFNPVAAGVGSILLFIAVVGAFTPTIFYHAFGMSSSKCDDCSFSYSENNTIHSVTCHNCTYEQNDLVHDLRFMEGARYLMYFSACILPLAYIIGMIFTFKTHAHIFKQDEEEEGERHGSPEWSIWASVLLMVVSIGMFGLIAEDVVHVVQAVLETLGVHQSFLGLTLIALTPAATELASAIKFALANQISLSVEIGSASAIQISLIQIPALTAISLIVGSKSEDGTPFNLIFPLLAVFAVLFAVLTFNYISAEGKTNYFVGASMVIIYMILIASFYHIPEDALKHPTNSTNSTAPAEHHLKWDL